MKRKQWTAAEADEQLKVIDANKETAVEAGKRLGLHASTIYAWRHRAKVSGSKPGRKAKASSVSGHGPPSPPSHDSNEVLIAFGQICTALQRLTQQKREQALAAAQVLFQ